MHPSFRLLIYSVLFCLVCALAACSPLKPQQIDLQPCFIRNVSAQCGTLSVYENRAAKTGRKIDIHVAVIKARGTNPAPDPVFYLSGGPGASSIEAAPYALLMLNSANEYRDVVLVDQRGTGGSNKLACPRPADQSSGLAPTDGQAIEDLKTCLTRLDGDPGAYTTAWGMDDLDDVRAALGYDQINLYGESYATVAEQVYLQRHARHVRTMILEGVTLIDVPIFERLPRSSQAALDLLLARCQDDAACQSAYPNLRAELAGVLSRLEKQPVDLPLTNPNTGKPVTLTRDMFVQGIHSLLIATERAILLPPLIHQAYQGNWSVIAQAVASSQSADAPAAEWNLMNLTILCHEDWAKLRPVETNQLSAGAYMGYEDVRRMTVPEEVCAVIPRPQPAALYRPVKASPAPVLLISNQGDPQNPPENVDGAKMVYPNSLTLIAPGQGHGYTGFTCRDQIISEFIEKGAASGLETGCLQEEPLPQFTVSE